MDLFLVEGLMDYRGRLRFLTILFVLAIVSCRTTRPRSSVSRELGVRQESIVFLLLKDDRDRVCAKQCKAQDFDDAVTEMQEQGNTMSKTIREFTELCIPMGFFNSGKEFDTKMDKTIRDNLIVGIVVGSMDDYSSGKSEIPWKLLVRSSTECLTKEFSGKITWVGSKPTDSHP